MVDENTETPESTEKGALEEEQNIDAKPEEKEEEKLTPFHEHKDWKDMYRRVKSGERENEVLKDDVIALKDANAELMNTLNSVDDKLFGMKEMPDPVEEPEKYFKHVLETAKRHLKKEKPIETKKKVIDKPVVNNNLAMLEAVESGLHSDYNEIVSGITAIDMKADNTLRLTIMQSDNPARAAYEYGLRKKETKEKQDKLNLNSAYVEGGQKPDESKNSKTIVLTPKQERAARLLGVPRDKYIKRYIEIKNTKK